MHRLSYNKILLACLGLCLIYACEKKDELSNTPKIDLLEFGPETVQEFTDSIYFRLAYEDGDGDLGENNTDDFNLKVTDARIGIDYNYRIRELVPNGANVPIKGELRFSISNTFITDTFPTQSVSYLIFIKDRAGNKSNVIQTKSILIKR